VVTTDPIAVAAFQTSANVLGFDGLPPNGGGGSQGSTGIGIQPESQLTDQFRGVGAVFSSTGGPAGVVSVEGLPNQADAKSPYNVIGGSIIGNPFPTLNYLEPIRMDFVLPGTNTPAPTSRIGAWNDPTGSRVRLSAFDIGGNLLESVEGDQGAFIGIINPAIFSATFSHVVNQGSQGFSLDDVTFGIVPEPASAMLLMMGLISLIQAGLKS
jgi:hypothetical protein